MKLSKTNSMSAEQLLQGCQKNDRKAQNELFRRYKTLVMSICRRYNYHSESCNDTFQDCFVEIFKSLKGRQEIRNLEAWIVRICININARSYYKESRATHGELKDEHLDEGHLDILDSLSGEEVMACIHQLPDGFRVVFNLYFIEGYKHTEIAQLLDISESTSRSQLARAKSWLKKELESLGIYKYEAS